MAGPTSYFLVFLVSYRILAERRVLQSRHFLLYLLEPNVIYSRMQKALIINFGKTEVYCLTLPRR
jgi:hypothetical protein